MKNILIVDGALNCAYDVYQVTDKDFKILFPGEGQDIEFSEDFDDGRVSDDVFDELFERMWKNRIKKKNINGIHGTIFYGLESKRQFYPNKKDSDLDENGGRST